MYHALYPTKDTTITDVEIRGTKKTGSNTGQSEIVELYVLTSSVGGRGKSRILFQFDINSLSASIVAGDIPSSSVEYRLRLKNSFHGQKSPSSFTVEAVPISKSWDEGNGLSMYDEELRDGGYANWVNATSLVSWDLPGGDTNPGLSVTQSFDTGFEDLNIDISSIVNAWLDNDIQRHGLMLKLIDAHETGSQDLFVKKFYSRNAHVPERRPRMEVLWGNNVFDDRGAIKYDKSGSLYYYRFVNGVAENVGPLFVDIINSSSAVVQTLTASIFETGIYHASGVFVSATSSTQIFRDVWFSGTNQVFTGAFAPTFATGSAFFDFNDLDVLLPNLKHEYDQDQKVVIRVLGKERNYRPAIRLSASTDVSPLILGEAYYSIEHSETEKVIVSYSTGAVEYSRLSHDKNGNYFKLWTSAFSPGNIYKIKILTFYNGQKYIFDKNWEFKVTND